MTADVSMRINEHRICISPAIAASIQELSEACSLRQVTSTEAHLALSHLFAALWEVPCIKSESEAAGIL